ncbi:PREDICTED: thioredoxin-related transmembrane protein 2-A-like [Priapulus caudatus]|uniref:Thioredoxin-related transmembrane protein 2-A-like n=1 Tax=Priapulus caudatus TaxID=37621 RepID=A0ABM1EXQ1_PRICU|nr:PREDICTED: thioredoxin-related transmembrane protein 2-A-like [Priapulus caudatus]
MYSKVVHLILFFRQDPKYSIMYGIICIVHHVLCPEASFKGPENITYFRGPHLEDEIKKDSRVTWIVAFYAAWSPDCISFASTFATMSIKYSLPNLKFGKMDASRYSIVAERFRIDVSPTSKQLPTVIVFQGGREKRRRPYIDYNGKVTRFVMAEEYLIKDLELNQIYEDCKKNPIKMRTKVKVEKKEETPAEGVPPPAEEKGSEEKKND